MHISFLQITHPHPLGASLSKSALGALLISAQRNIQVQLNLGHGSDRIHNILPGRYWRYKVDLVLYANDLQSGHRVLTWSELFQAIDLVRYCGFDGGIYLEMLADIYIRYVRVESLWLSSFLDHLHLAEITQWPNEDGFIKGFEHSVRFNVI